jgi:hypothetical protein
MRVVLVVLAVVLAGCPALGPQPPPTGAESGGESEDGSVTAASYPPGVTDSGVTDATALAEAHADITGDASYTLRSNRTIRYTNGDLASRLLVRLRLAADRQFHVRASTAGPEGPLLLGTTPAGGEYWSNGTVYVRALTREGETTYNRFSPPDNFVGTWRYWRATVPFGGEDGHAAETIGGLFRDVPTEVVDVRSEAGTTVYRLSGEGAHSGSFAKAGPGPVGDVTLGATVTESGLVRGFDLSYVTFLGNRSVRVDWSLRYRDVGNTSVDRPAWFDRAVDGSGNRSSARVAVAGAQTTSPPASTPS